MAVRTEYISYRDTGYFPDLVMDYLEEIASVKPFYHLPPNIPGIAEAIRHRQKNPVNRELLVSHLLRQYESVHPDQQILAQITSLQEANTFTVTTAHQPN